MLHVCRTNDGAPIWIDLLNPTPEEIEQVRSEWHLQVPSRAQMEEVESSSRLSVQDGTIHVNMPVVAHQDEDTPTPLGFVLAKDKLLTVRYTHLYGFDTALAHFDKEGGAKSSTEAFATLAEGIIDYGADALEKIGADLNNVSRRVFRNYGNKRPRNSARSNRALRDTLVAVGECGEKLSQIRESLLGLQRILPYIMDKAREWVPSGVSERLKTAGQDLQSLNDFEAHLSNKVQFLLDAVLGFINTEQNDIFKVLTIVSVVGIPPTLIASMYGMNFHNVPEYNWAWGYQWGLFLIVFSALIPTLWFKWRGWW
jgi:magnesium transporter